MTATNAKTRIDYDCGCTVKFPEGGRYFWKYMCEKHSAILLGILEKEVQP